MNDNRLPVTPKNTRISLKYSDPTYISAAKRFHKNVLHHLIDAKIIDSPDDFTFCNRNVLVALGEEKLIKQYDYILSENGLSENEFWGYFEVPNSEYATTMGNNNTDLPLTFVLNTNKEYLTINVHPYISRKQWFQSWKSVKKQLKTLPDYRQPKELQHLELFYAVHKERNKGTKWLEITDLVNNNRLKGYVRQKGTKQKWEQRELENYYIDYKKYVAK